jgi:hypothetical protein
VALLAIVAAAIAGVGGIAGIGLQRLGATGTASGHGNKARRVLLLAGGIGVVAAVTLLTGVAQAEPSDTDIHITIDKAVGLTGTATYAIDFQDLGSQHFTLAGGAEIPGVRLIDNGVSLTDGETGLPHLDFSDGATAAVVYGTLTAEIDADAPLGDYSGTVTYSATDARTEAVVTVVPNDKRYDRTTAATFAIQGITGVAPGEEVGAEPVDALVGEFAQPNAGNDLEVTLTGGNVRLTGKDAHKYTVTVQAVGTADISKAAFAVYGDVLDKDYDGKTDAEPWAEYIEASIATQFPEEINPILGAEYGTTFAIDFEATQCWFPSAEPGDYWDDEPGINGDETWCDFVLKDLTPGGADNWTFDALPGWGSIFPVEG